jgi:hypothetical protein
MSDLKPLTEPERQLRETLRMIEAFEKQLRVMKGALRSQLAPAPKRAKMEFLELPDGRLKKIKPYKI